MENLRAFLRAFLSDGYALMTGIVSTLLTIAASWWDVDQGRLMSGAAYICAAYAAFRIWRSEYQMAGPQVLVIYETPNKKAPERMDTREYHAGGGGELELEGLRVLVRNVSKIPAYNIRIYDIRLLIDQANSIGAVASFAPIQVLLKEESQEVQVTIEPSGPLFCHNFNQFLKAAWNSQGSLDSLKVPITVSCTDVHGRAFETESVIDYHFYVVRTEFKEYRRVSKKARWPKSQLAFTSCW